MRGLGGLVGQGADLVGDDRKTAPGLSGAGGLDARVQRQQVGLERDLVDDGDDGADLAGRFLDLAHGTHGLLDDLSAALGVALCGLGAGLGGGHALGRLIDAARHLVQGGHGLLKVGGLLFGAVRQVMGGGADLGQAAADDGHTVDHQPQGLVQLTE